MDLNNFDFDSIKSLEKLLNEAPKMLMSKLSQEDKDKVNDILSKVDKTDINEINKAINNLKNKQDAN